MTTQIKAENNLFETLNTLNEKRAGIYTKMNELLQQEAEASFGTILVNNTDISILRQEREGLNHKLDEINDRIQGLLEVIQFTYGMVGIEGDNQSGTVVMEIYQSLPLEELTELEKLTIKFFLRKMNAVAFVSQQEMVDMMIEAIGTNQRAIQMTLIGLMKKEIICAYRSRRVQGFRLYATYMIETK